MTRRPLKIFLIATLLAMCLLAGILSTMADPAGVSVLSNSTVSPTPQAAASITTAGGSFTTLLLNATTQTPRWKAYVGNVTGRFTLKDDINFTIYDWQIASIAGEVYASRNSSVTWSSIRCAVNATLVTEQNQLNITTTKEDSINRTFNTSIHRSFYVGTTLIANSSCRAIATYVNNSRQAATESATFQEVVLDDTQKFVYTTLLQNKSQGYNNQPYDFQLIVAESEYNVNPSPYYFWAELS